MSQMVKYLPAMQETWVQFLGQEDPLEKGMATHCSTLAWRIQWTEEPGRLQSMGSQSQTRLSDFHFPPPRTKSLVKARLTCHVYYYILTASRTKFILAGAL